MAYLLTFLIAVSLSQALGLVFDSDASSPKIGGSTTVPNRLVKECNQTLADVVFVLDSSSSLGLDNFNDVKQFVINIVNAFDIGRVLTQVGVITFASNTTERINLDKYHDKQDLVNAIRLIPYSNGGYTRTDQALDLARQEGFKGGRPNTPDIVIVVTDGQSTNPELTRPAADALRATGTTVFAVGVGSSLKPDELYYIASDPDSKHVFFVANFTELSNIEESVAKTACEEECNQTLADVVFVLDSSGSLGLGNFNAVLQFVINIVNAFDIGRELTQVGVITFSRNTTERINLDKYHDKQDLVNAIRQIPYVGGYTRTDQALDLARQEGFKGGRPNTPDIVIVVTDGQSTNPELTRPAADALRATGTTVFAVGVGSSLKSELYYIASDPDSKHVFFVTNFTELASIEESVAKTACEVPLLPATTPVPMTTTVQTPSTPKTPTPAPSTMSTNAITITVVCTAKVADVVFLVDSSGSVGSGNYVTMKNYVKQVIGNLDIGSFYTRVGLITFSTAAKLEFGLTKYNTSAQLNSAVDAISYAAGGTNTGSALELLRQGAFTNERPSDPNIAVVITDGYSKDKVATKQEALLAKNAGVTIIAIGIGNATDFGELTDIASYDTNTNQSLVYQVGDFGALATLDSVVANVACTAAVSSNHTVLPTTMMPTTVETSNCTDTVNNCAKYGNDICYDYKPWAMAHCALHCGFCKGPATPAPQCKNNIDNCANYGTYICTTTSLLTWANENCRLYCGLCGDGQVPTDPPATVAATQEECNQTLADVVFVLDSSGSLGLGNFNAVLQFVINIVNAFDIGRELTQVGVITFSRNTTERINLDKYHDKQDLVNAIRQIPYVGGYTRTDQALDLARQEGFKGGRPNTPDIVIVVTDGQSTNPELTRPAADALRATGTTVFAVGVGSSLKSELYYIASDPNSKHVFFVTNFTELASIEESVAKTACEVPLLPATTPVPMTTTVQTPSTPKTPTPAPSTMSTNAITITVVCTAKVADVVFLVDSSGSVGSGNYVTMKNYVKQVIGNLDIGSFYTRVGLITFSTAAKLEFGLTKYNTSAQLNSAVDAISYAAGGTNTGSALELLRQGAFTNERPSDPNIAVVITDGYSKDKVATKQEALLAKNAGVTIIAIGIGNATDFGELTDIASYDTNTNQSLVYQVGDFGALATLDSVVANVACTAAVSSNHTVLPTTMMPTTVETSNCTDTVNNCAKYGNDICYDYKPWAMAHCALHCGFCKGPATPAPQCKNNIDNCANYGTYICTTTSLLTWANENCRLYCGLCGDGQVPTDPPATVAATQAPCKNTINNCDEYGGKYVCTAPAYEAWAKTHCREYCVFCTNTLVINGATLPNNMTCPDWRLPKECSLVSYDGSCCPLPLCPPGYALTVKAPNELS